MQAATSTMEASKSADVDEHEQAATTYAERYLDVVQNLPNDLQRVISQVRELDTRTCMELREYEVRHKAYVKDLSSGDTTNRGRSHVALRRSLVRERELGDEKLQLANQLVDMVENAARVLKDDLQHLESVQTDPDYSVTNGGSGGSYSSRHDYQNSHAADMHAQASGGGGSHHASGLAAAAAAAGSHHHHHPHAAPGPQHPFHALSHAGAGHASAGASTMTSSSAAANYLHRGDERAASGGASVPAPKRRKSAKAKPAAERDHLGNPAATAAAAAGSHGDGGGIASSTVAGHQHKDGSAAARPDKRRRKDKPGGKRGGGGDRSGAGGGALQKNALPAGGAAMAGAGGGGGAVAALAQHKAQATTIPPDMIIDPNEPTYCVCRQVSFGEMIGCDNPTCVVEWFHFACVGLASKPKGKWYCPNCRRDHNRADQAKLSSEKSGRGR